MRAELERFVGEAAPQNASADNYITAWCDPACGRQRALALAERVRPILDRLYPEWRDDNEPDPNLESARERDASTRLLERLASQLEIEQMLGNDDASPRLIAGPLHPLVWRAASAQWATGHLHEAVLAAAKAVNSQLQAKLARRDLSEVKLARDAFSEKPARRAARGCGSTRSTTNRRGSRCATAL